MYLESELKDRLLEQISVLIDNQDSVEWEFVIGRSSGYFGQVNRGIFQDLIRRLKSIPDIKEIKSQETLDITLVSKDNIPIRATLTGRDNIILFCREDAKVLNSLKFLYKTKVINGKEERPVDIPNYGIRSNLKSEIPIHLEVVNKDPEAEQARQAYVKLIESKGGNGFYKLLKTFRYKNRISYQSKEGFTIDLTVVKNSKVDYRVHKSGDRIYNYSIPALSIQGADLLNQPETYEVEIEAEIDKIADYIGTYDRELEDEEHEMSDEEGQIYELDNNPSIQNKILQYMIRNVGSLLQVQQNWVNITPNDKSDLILTKYMGLVNTTVKAMTEGGNLKSSNLENLKSLLATKLPGQEILPSKSDTSKYSVSEHRRFIGPKPISLGLRNIQETGDININQHYTVTDKADGDGNLLYLDENGDGYLIDSNLRVRFSGIRCPEESNTILNGEFISKDLGGNINYSYYCYDIYIRRGQPVHDLPLCYPEIWKDKKTTLKTRLDEMRECVLQLPHNDDNNILKVHVKQFYFLGSLEDPLSSGKTIYDLSKVCWQNFQQRNTPYKYDGLIYTPMYLPAGYSGKDEFLLLLGLTWGANFKWKPPDENSIDFLVETQKETVFNKGKTVIEKDVIRQQNILEDDGDVTPIKYKTLNLYVGGYSTPPTSNCQYQDKSVGLSPGSDFDSVYGKKLFNPVLPAVENVNMAPVKLHGNQLLSVDDGNIIEDGTVVECAYNLDAVDDFKWTAKRTRYDKTFDYLAGRQKQQRIYIYLKSFFNSRDKSGRFLKNSNFVKNNEWRGVRLSKNRSLDFDYKRGYLRGQRYLDAKGFMSLVAKYHHESSRSKNSLFDYLQRNFDKIIPDASVVPIAIKYGQNEEVANNIWLTIHQPVTEEMITTGRNIPPTTSEDEVYYESTSLENRHKSQTFQLQKYHNFIKRTVLLKPASKLVPDRELLTILDLACGKGGDLPKWKDIGANIVVGTDIAKDNLENSKDGACVRYRNLVKQSKERGETYPMSYFFQADSKLNIINEIKSRDDEASKVFRRLWYEFPDGNDPELIYPRFDENKFSTISLQFALHYFMQNTSSLSGILDNVSNNLKRGGVFIGSCLDGSQVYQALEGKTSIQGEHNGNVIWKIEKGYQLDSLPDTNQCLGQAIDVYMSSINRKHREYLVNFNYLKHRFAEHPYNLHPVTAEMAKTMGLPSCYNPATGLISFRQLAEDITTDKTNLPASRELHYIKTALGKMSEAEREISYLNVGFVFYKTA